MTITQLRGRLQQEPAYTVTPDGQGYRAEAEGWSGPELARRLLADQLSVPCFGRMGYPNFWGRAGGAGETEADALAAAQDAADELRQRVEAGVAQLVRCAYCPLGEACHRVTTAGKTQAG